MRGAMPDWKRPTDLEDHFRRHGREVGARTAAQYHALALRTIERGVRFTSLRTGVLRIGYYDMRNHHFVVMEDEETIVSLSRRSENHVRTLARSTYRR
jgi:hypothetical protein